MSNTRQKIGRMGESLAEKYLNERGYTVRGRNVHTSYGEIDLVARLGEIVVFMEVKTRRSKAYGLPEISVNLRKLNHMRQSAEAYMQAHPESGAHWQVDVIAIQISKEAEPELVHFENVLT